MSHAKPYGDPKTATILVIGHDPRLPKSASEAEYAFFMEYLDRPAAGRGSQNNAPGFRETP